MGQRSPSWCSKKGDKWKKDKEKKEEIINNIIGYKKHLQDILNIIDDTKSDIQPVKNQKEEGFKEKERTDIITLKKKDSIIFVKPSDIYYLASNQGKVTIVVRDDQYQSWDTLKVWEKRLKGYGFLRCHRSYLVNVEKIKTITPWFKDTYNLKLHDISHEIYCSKSYIKDLKDFISIRHQNSPWDLMILKLYRKKYMFYRKIGALYRRTNFLHFKAGKMDIGK